VQFEIHNAVVIPVVVGRDFTILSRQRRRRRAACDQCRAGDCYDGQMTLDEARRSEEGGHNTWLLTEVRANNKQRPKTPNACSGGRVGRNRFGSLQGGTPAATGLILLDGLRERNVARFQIQLGFGRGAEDFGAVVVEFALPAGNDDGGETVADQVDAGAAHVH
jgi:hypothetical protein